MIWFKRLFDFYINSSIHVALAVYALTYITLTRFDLPYTESVLYFIFFSTIIGYNFVKYFSVILSQKKKFAVNVKAILLVSIISGVSTLYYFMKLKGISIVVILLFGFLTFLYAFPFTNKNFNFWSIIALRNIPGIKIYVIALVWSGVSVLLPVLELNLIINTNVWLTIYQVFILVIALMIPFEIRDLQYDATSLKTIPQLIGMKATKLMGVVLLLCFVWLEVLKTNSNGKSILAVCLVTILLALLILFSKEKQAKYYCSFWVEAIPIVWLLVLLF